VAPDVLAITRWIALATLPLLGVIARGGGLEASGSAASPLSSTGEVAGHDGGYAHAPMGATVRLTPRGRALLGGAKVTVDPTPSRFVETHALRVAQSAKVAHVLGLAAVGELGRVGDQLDILLTPQAMARALSAGVESDALRARIELVAPLPESLSRMLLQASAVIGRGTLALASAFLWVDDPEVRELLRTRRPACELFVDPSPPGGLLVFPDVDLERVVRRCRALGVEVEVEAGVVRARTHTTPPPGRVAARPSSVPPPRVASTPPPRLTPAEGTKRPKR
jgi:hypothetical protein